MSRLTTAQYLTLAWDIVDEYGGLLAQVDAMKIIDMVVDRIEKEGQPVPGVRL